MVFPFQPAFRVDDLENRAADSGLQPGYGPIPRLLLQSNPLFLLQRKIPVAIVMAWERIVHSGFSGVKINV